MTKSQPLCVLVGVVTSCVLCARVRGRVSRSCATENTYSKRGIDATERREYYIFSIADGTAELSGRDHELRGPLFSRELQGEREGFIPLKYIFVPLAT